MLLYRVPQYNKIYLRLQISKNIRYDAIAMVRTDSVLLIYLKIG